MGAIGPIALLLLLKKTILTSFPSEAHRKKSPQTTLNEKELRLPIGPILPTTTAERYSQIPLGCYC